jgi:putative phosphoribosyl transferase
VTGARIAWIAERAETLGEVIMLRDRREAGVQLAGRLRGYQTERPLILALNRGGTQVAASIAQSLRAPEDVIITRPVLSGPPAETSRSLGAVALGGGCAVDGELAESLGVDRAGLEQRIADARRGLDAADANLRGDLPFPDVRGRVVILVADGMSSEQDEIAAIRSVRSRGPRWLVLALPFCSADTARDLLSEADAVVTLSVGEPTGPVYQVGAGPADREAAAELDRHRVADEEDRLYHASEIDE